MIDKTKLGVHILKAAIILGISGNMLIRGVEPGINILMWVALLAAAMAATRFRTGPEPWNAQIASLFAALIFFSAMFGFRDSPELMILDGLAVLGILSLLILPSEKIRLHATGVVVYLVSGIWTGFAAIFAPFFVLIWDIDWNKFARNGLSAHLFSVAKGLVIAIPLVFIFGGLLMSADANYQSFVENTLSFDAGSAAANIVFTIFLSWITLGYLRAGVLRFRRVDAGMGKARETEDIPAPKFSITENDTEEPVPGPGKTEAGPEMRKTGFDWKTFGSPAVPRFMIFGKVETIVVLGLMNLVFLSFVVVQAPYLFGGMDFVQSTPDFKLAEYARRGVGELIAVSLLVLPVLLSIHWLLPKEGIVTENAFKILAGIQIGLLFIIMFSAVQRLLLLTGSLGYGFTTFRFYAMFWLIFLAMVFVWFSVTVLRGMRKHFPWGALWSGFFVIAALHLVNPDDFIVRTNVELMKHGRSFDASYNSSLSADAVPALIESLQWMDADQCDRVVHGLRKTGIRLEGIDDYRSWNWSRSRAQNTEEIRLLIKRQPWNGCRNP